MSKTETTRSAGRLMTVIGNSVSRLRNSIMQGELRPGQKLIEADVCRQLQISRASLREVLRILETERLIEMIPNRGPSVAKLGWEEIAVSYTHLRAHETPEHLVCRLLLEKKKKSKPTP